MGTEKAIVDPLATVRACLAKTLRLPDPVAATVTRDTTAVDLPAWTSLTHLSLILELEKTFGVRFADDEIASLGSVEAILSSLVRKGVAGT